ncbi:MAG: 4-hydroxy-tetrahydrodipicolinate reductase [Ruminococcaceae bacterium]|nr:4-hydroxy-tetrahydrodipicolinate reductase [Oscillospiraceae bacterium]
MKVIVNGACGRMGKVVLRLLSEGYRGASYAGGIDAFSDDTAIVKTPDALTVTGDVIIDFSSHLATGDICAYAAKTNTPIVVCTTGHTEEELAVIHETAKNVPVFHSANMSLGVALLCELARQAAALYPDADVEIVETHHNRKLDAPSGTALMIADRIREERPEAVYKLGRAGHEKREPREIGIHAVRMGNVVGEHEVRIGTDTETITLKHEAHDRSLFAEGAIVAARYLIGQSAGLYGMRDMLG